MTTAAAIRHDLAETAEKISGENLASENQRSINKSRQEHVMALATDLGCDVIQRSGMAGMMYVEYEPPMIEGPTIETQRDYVIMLHELGHVAHGHTQGRPPFDDKKFYFENGVLRSEAEAWRWAMDNSLEELETSTREFMWNGCLGTYYAQGVRTAGAGGQRLGNGNRHWVEYSYDKPDDFFWRTVQMMLGELPPIYDWVVWKDGTDVPVRSGFIRIAARANSV